MERRIGPLKAEVIRGEGDKFTSPLLLVHGLWASAASWRPFMGYLAHRGWHCVAVNLRGRNAEPSTLAEHLSDLHAVIGALDAPPVVLGHDLGALLGLHLAARARSVVALAPLVLGPLAPPPAALGRSGSWLARRLGWARRPPRSTWRVAYPERLRVESGALIASLERSSAGADPQRTSTPAVVFAAAQDSVTPLADARRLAEHAGAELRVVTGSDHALLSDHHWQERVGEVHRWIIQRLGTSLLALYEEDEG